MPLLITITANGENFTVPAGQSLNEFLGSQGLRPGFVIVERNGLALTPSESHATTLENGDVLEIVRIVAGG